MSFPGIHGRATQRMNTPVCVADSDQNRRAAHRRLLQGAAPSPMSRIVGSCSPPLPSSRALVRMRAHAFAEQRLLPEVAHDVDPSGCASPRARCTRRQPSVGLVASSSMASVVDRAVVGIRDRGQVAGAYRSVRALPLRLPGDPARQLARTRSGQRSPQHGAAATRAPPGWGSSRAVR